MNDDMDDQELERLLRLVDEPVDEVPASYERRLWDELSATFDAPVPEAPGEPVGPGEPTEIAFIPIDERRADRVRWTRWGSLAAALVAVLAIGVFLVAGDDDPGVTELPDTTLITDATTVPPTTSPPTTSPPTTAPPVQPTNPPVVEVPAVLLDPVEACQRFGSGVAPLLDLADVLMDPAAPAGGRVHVESVQTALELYAADLEAGGRMDETSVLRFRNAARTLDQALAELDAGEPESASRTVAGVRDAVGGLLGELDIPGLDFDPLAADLLIECG